MNQIKTDVDHSNGTRDQKSDNTDRGLGVYTLENRRYHAQQSRASGQLAIAQKLCDHNAQVCSSLGQTSKSDTWALLAQTIESSFTFEMVGCNGWGGHEDSLTTGIIEQVLLFYESQGDFQMLASMLCVLTFGRDRRTSSKKSTGRYQLLPRFDKRRYDNYLRRYGALLYGWGMLTVRAEILKRSASGDFVPTTSDVAAEITNCDLKCSICCLPVRGACTWCPLCGHGECHCLGFHIIGFIFL